MATFYVRKTGSDAAAGTSAATAWQTINKALATLASGDVCYIGAGTYFETHDLNLTDKTSATRLVGDPDGSHTGDPGEVVMSGWTSGYTSAPALAKMLNLGRFWQVENMTIYGGGTWQSASYAGIQMSRDNKIINCTVVSLGDSPALTIQNLTVNPCNIVVEKCHIIGMIETFTISVGAFSGSGDIDTNLIIRNNILQAQEQMFGGILNYNNVSSRKVGGMLVYHNTFLPNSSGVVTVEGGSTVFPAQVKYNIIPAGTNIGGGQSTEALYSDTAGALVEDYNFLYGPDIVSETFRNGVTAGTHSLKFADFLYLNTGHRAKYGMSVGDIWAPVDESPVVQMFNDVSDPVTDDLYGGPRPTGGKTPGAVEPRRGWVREATTVRTGSNALARTGWGYQDFDVAVDATSTTLSVWMRKDTNYTGTAPKFQIRNGTEAGVADTEATMSVGADTWEQLSLTFTPTSAGIITVRLLSQDTAGNGRAFADDRSGW